MVKKTLQTNLNAETDQEENPVLQTQRYLNIFHQIHIFTPEQRAKFEESLLQMPDKYRELLPTIPGGRILAEYIDDLVKKSGKEVSSPQKITPTTPAQNKQEHQEINQKNTITTPVVNHETINMDSDFAKNLANSLAVAFKNNHLAPGGNLNELSTVIGNSFNAYAQNMQQLTTDLLEKNMDQLVKTQNYMQQQLAEQNNWQADFQNKLSTQIDKKLEQTQQQIQSQMHNQLNWQSKMQEQFEHNIFLQTQSAAANKNAAQLNAQTNNANTTTINNVNIDSSSFNGITKAIRESQNQRNEYFKKIIEVLNKNFAQSSKQKTTELPVLAITNSITEALRENSKQQLAAIKAFGETLSQSIRQSQHELAQTLGKSFSQTEKIFHNEETPQIASENIVTTSKNNNNAKNKKDAAASDAGKQKNNNKSSEPSLKQQQATSKTTSPKENKPLKQNPLPEKTSVKSEKLDDDFATTLKNTPAKTSDNFSLDDILTDAPDVDLDTAFADLKTNTQKNKTTSIPTDDDLSAAFLPDAPTQKEKPVAVKTEKQSQQPPQKKIKPSPQAHFYDDAMQKIKDALQSTETVSLNELDGVNPVSLSHEETEVAEPDFIDTPFDEDLLAEFTADDKKENDTQSQSVDTPADDEWEYVDEDGNPITADEDDEWEYVDEDGNPITADEDDEWEYVDENGNPVNTSENDQWEYVDENGNPIDTDEDDEWEYVDENGNPVDASENDEWEYVDEDGNPIDTDENDEWEYVDEDDQSNKATTNESTVNDDDFLAAFTQEDK